MREIESLFLSKIFSNILYHLYINFINTNNVFAFMIDMCHLIHLSFLLASIELNMMLNELKPFTRPQQNSHSVPNQMKPNRTEPGALNLLHNVGTGGGGGGGGAAMKENVDCSRRDSTSGSVVVSADPPNVDPQEALPTRTPPARPIRRSRYCIHFTYIHTHQ